LVFRDPDGVCGNQFNIYKMKKWHIVIYRLLNQNGPILKTKYETRIFSETESSLLIQNALKHLFNLETKLTPIPESIISLNNDGTETEVENALVGSELYQTWNEARKKRV
jgi:hypothetical protein